MQPHQIRWNFCKHTLDVIWVHSLVCHSYLAVRVCVCIAVPFFCKIIHQILFGCIRLYVSFTGTSSQCELLCVCALLFALLFIWFYIVAFTCASLAFVLCISFPGAILQYARKVVQKKGTAMHTHSNTCTGMCPQEKWHISEWTAMTLDELWCKKKGTAMHTHTHTHTHWDVAQGKKKHKRMHRNDIIWIMMQKEEQSHLHTHTNTRTGMWSKEKRHTKRMHKRRTSESTHVKSDGIILQKEEHSHAYTPSYWNVAPGKETRKNECTRDTQANATI